MKYKTKTIVKTSRLQRKTELLNEFKQTIVLGYNEEGWNKAARLYRELQEHLSLQELQNLGKVWRDTYTKETFLDSVNSI